jgi:hypothetical protein
MKTTILLIGIILASIGTTNFGFKETAKECGEQDSNSKKTWTTAMQGYLTNSSIRVNDDLYFFIGQPSWRSIKTSQLKKAVLISDIIDAYPTNWISNYKSVIVTSNNGNKSIGNDIKLTKEQLLLINGLVVNDELQIEIQYEFKNSVTNKLEGNTMIVNMIVEPEIPAEPTQDYEVMINKTKSDFLSQMNMMKINWMNEFSISFIINEKGDAKQIQVKTTTGNPKTDSVLVELVKQLPSWTPAKDENNQPVKQAAVFSVGMNGC